MKAWLRYKFDSTMSRGVSALIAWLFLFCAILAAIVALFTLLIDPHRRFLAVWWIDFQTTSTFKPGTGHAMKVIRDFVPNLGGMFMGGLLTGLIVGGIQNKLRNLRKGRSIVVEKGHQVILGWSDSVFTVIQELCIANEDRKNPAIVILADKDKVEMEDSIRAKVPHTGRTKIVCRTGNPVDPRDLHLTNPQTARSFVVLAPDTSDPDAQVIKIMMALVNNPEVDPREVVAEMRDGNKIEAARLLSDGKIRLLSMDDLIARITVQACRQAGTSLIYADLLTFEGDEMYLREEPSLEGKTFGESLFAYERGAVVGLVRDHQTRFNPPSDEKLARGDKLVVIAEDEASIAPSGRGRALVEDEAIVDGKHRRERRAVRALILGWNRRAPATIRLLDEQVDDGSEIVVVADLEDGEARLTAECPDVEHARLSYKRANIADGAVLRSLRVETYDHIVVLGYSDRLDAHEADAQTLVTLVFLRAIRKELGKGFSIVTEMLEPENRKLAEVAHADDFVVSTQLVSQMLAQMSENPDLTYNELFEATGSEIDLRPMGRYVKLGQPVRFATVVESARRRGEVAVGYRIEAESHDPSKNFGIHLNPAKSSGATFDLGDSVILIAPN